MCTQRAACLSAYVWNTMLPHLAQHALPALPQSSGRAHATQYASLMFAHGTSTLLQAVAAAAESDDSDDEEDSEDESDDEEEAAPPAKKAAPAKTAAAKVLPHTAHALHPLLPGTAHRLTRCMLTASST
jgi:hypothetical protein